MAKQTYKQRVAWTCETRLDELVVRIRELQDGLDDKDLDHNLIEATVDKLKELTRRAAKNLK